MNILQFKPTTEQLLQASQFANAYDQHGFGKNVLGVSYEEYISFIRIGKLCEIILADFLRLEDIEFEAPEMLIPHPGNHKKGADLLLTHSGQEVDIKAANKSFHKRILIREDQFQAHIHDIYIGAKYHNDQLVEYHGYITGDEMNKITPRDFGYGLCRYMLLDQLKPMDQFVLQCKLKNRIS